MLFWLPVLGSPPLRPLAVSRCGCCISFVALPQGALLGFVLRSARAPLYPHYARRHAVRERSRRPARRRGRDVDRRRGLLFSRVARDFGVWARRENRAGALAASLAVSTSHALDVPWLLVQRPGPRRPSRPNPRGKLLYKSTVRPVMVSAAGIGDAPSLVGESASDVHLMLDTGLMPASVPNANEIHARPRFTANR